jgi:hypothetical protein|nr:MAG TPA: hypothetical protein [Caudoviricetes sp.]
MSDAIININGEECVKKAEAYCDSEHVCVIAERGWIFEGYREGDGFKLTRSHVVRRWDNGLGIGAIADPEHKEEYVLDYIGNIEIIDHSVIAVIPLGW